MRPAPPMARAILTLALCLIMTSCKQTVSDTASAGGVALNPCTSTNGRGYGAVYKCGTIWCAKNNIDFTHTCSVNISDPCVQQVIANDSREQVDPTQPIQSVGANSYYNVCPSDANDGKGYGSPWNCGVAMCAHPDQPYQKFCVIADTGGNPATASDLNASINGSCGSVSAVVISPPTTPPSPSPSPSSAPSTAGHL